MSQTNDWSCLQERVCLLTLRGIILHHARTYGLLAHARVCAARSHRYAGTFSLSPANQQRINTDTLRNL